MAVLGAASFSLEAPTWQERLAQLETRYRRLALAAAALCVLVLLLAAGWSRGKPAAVGRAHAEAGSPLPCGGPLTVSHDCIQKDGQPLCREYREVCFDQERVISHDSAYSPSNATSVGLPKIDLSDIQFTWAGADDGQNGDRFHQSIFNYEPISFRPATKLEPTPDLQHPVFSNCTVPVVMWSPWPHNYGEVVSHIFARLWRLQHDGAMSKDNLLVMATPNGEDAPAFIPFSFRAFSEHPALTFAELSSRKPSHPYGRCFRTAYLCKMGGAGFFPGMYSAMRAIFQQHQPQLPRAPYPPFDAGKDVLKVLIEHRVGSVRNILNWQELEQQCNKFTGWKLENTPFKRVQCRSATFNSDPLHNFAAVADADVLVIVHGSGCANWLAMRERSAMLELRPYEFGSSVRGWSDWFYPQISDNIQHAVFWYALNIEDEAASKPSQREVEKVNPDDARYKRDRHIILPFPALQDMLQRVAAAGRDRTKYIQQRQSKVSYMQLKPGGVLEPA